MLDYSIDVSIIEELQNISDKDELERIFAKAKSTLVNGAHVILVRKKKNGLSEKFDELSTLQDLQQYKITVFKYL